MILRQILAVKHQEVVRLKQESTVDLRFFASEEMRPARSLKQALTKVQGISLLAEVKGASPSKGILRKNYKPSEIAAIYSQNGAAAISVLTDREFFGGSAESLSEVRESTSLPILRKDFIIDPIQIYQSRVIGADAVLLICAILTPEKLLELINIAAECGMEALVEVHNEEELKMATNAGSTLIGINNRDLKTFRTDLATTFCLSSKVQDKRLVLVSESGIKTASDMESLKRAGIHAALVGEALMSAEDIGEKVRELAGRDWE